MNKLTKNAYLLLICVVINSIVSVFIYSFLLAFVLGISHNGIINVAKFYIILHISMTCLAWLLAPFFKKFNKTFCLRLGIIFKFLFVLLCVFLYDNIISYIFLIAICNALSESLFWGAVNPLQPKVVEKRSLAYYLSIIKIFGTIISIIIPPIMGALIDNLGIFIISIIMLVAVTTQLIISAFIKYNDEECNIKLNYKNFFKDISHHKQKVKRIYFNQLLFGFCSNVSTLILYYTFVTFGSNISIGIFSTLTSVIAIIMLAIFNSNKKIFSNYLTPSVYSILLCAGMLALILFPNKISVTFLNIIWGIAIVVPETITGEKRLNIINTGKLKKYNIENVTISETFLDVGRIIGELTILTMGIINNRIFDIIVLVLVAIIVSFYYFHSTYLQKLYSRNL